MPNGPGYPFPCRLTRVDGRDVDKLQAYRDKRDASRTPEPVPAEPVPAGEAPAGEDGDGGTFVIQEHHARRLHWDFRLERDGVLVSWALPKGVPDDPAVNHLAVHTEDHPLEYGGFEGEIPRGQYGAGAVTIWDSGRYETLKWAPKEVKVRLHGRRVTGEFALFQTRGNQWMIHRDRQPLPTGIRPMLATSWATPPPDDGNWALEMKWDGVRALAFVERGRVRLMSRTERDITVAYPELAGLGDATDHKQLLLDGEIVVFGEEGWPEFEALQPRMHVSDASQAKLLAGQNPVTYLVFDLLQLDGRPLLDEAYAERRALLDELGLAGPYWQTPPSFPGEDFPAVQAVSRRARHGRRGGQAAGLEVPARGADRSLAQDQEPAAPGGRRGRLQAGQGQPDRPGRVAAHRGERRLRADLRGSRRDRVQRRDAAHAGQRLEPLRRPDSPFDGPVPPEHARTAVWVEPRLVIEVTFDRWTRAGRMRAPVYKGLRDDKDPADVIRE